jgi:hypothetical protein
LRLRTHRCTPMLHINLPTEAFTLPLLTRWTGQRTTLALPIDAPDQPFHSGHPS